MIFELRRTLSRNKKYKYIYEIIVDDTIVYTRKTDKEYTGCYVGQKDGAFKGYHFFKDATTLWLISRSSWTKPVALTFSALLTIK
jgi:hypothetical protein